MWVLYGLLAAAGLFLGVLLLRAATFRPHSSPCQEAPGVSYDRDGAVEALRQLVQCRTVSHTDPNREDRREFDRFLSLLPQLYPKVFSHCSLQQLPERGLLLRWKGLRSDAPSVMMAHYDVVDVDESQWDQPPFAGVMENGVLWGRGTLDTKATFNGILFAAETLIAQGFQPKQDLYFAFSGSEEINGNGAKHIVDHFIAQGIHPELVLDEGGAVVENVFPGVTAPCALIGIGEKGMMNVEFSVVSNGGHASAPVADTPIELLSRACLQVQSHPFPMDLSKAAQQLFDTLGRHSTFGYRVIFANLWCFSPALNLICRKKGGELNALVRTTTAFTQMEGSTGRNVLPTRATLVSNMRLSPNITVAQAHEHLRKSLGDERVQIRILESFEPSPVSDTQCRAYGTLAETVSQTWPGCIVSPYLMVQCADARHYGVLSDHVYRFCPMELTAEERKTIHGNNEGIRLDAIGKVVEFYIRLMRKC